MFKSKNSRILVSFAVLSVVLGFLLLALTGSWFWFSVGVFWFPIMVMAIGFAAWLERWINAGN